MFVIGWFVVPLQAAVITILQQSTPDGERGRVMSVVQAAMSAAGVLSMGFAGIVGDAIGIREVMFAAGGITGIGFLVALVGYRRHDGARSAVAADPGDAVAPDVGDAAAPGMPVA
jgi:MFS family permease